MSYSSSDPTRGEAATSPKNAALRSRNPRHFSGFEPDPAPVTASEVLDGNMAIVTQDTASNVSNAQVNIKYTKVILASEKNYLGGGGGTLLPAETRINRNICVSSDANQYTHKSPIRRTGTY